MIGLPINLQLDEKLQPMVAEISLTQECVIFYRIF